VNPHSNNHHAKNEKPLITTMLTARRAGRPRKNAAAPAPAIAAVVPPNPIAWSPPEQGGAYVSETAMQQAVSRMTAEGRPENTKLAYDGKTAEFYQYCASLYPTDPFKNNLESIKVWNFMFYQCMRPKRKQGGAKKRADGVDTFVRSDYEEVMASYKTWFEDQSEAPPEPADPVGKSMVAQYKAAIYHIYEDQCAKKVCSANWDQIWLAPIKNLETLVKERRASNNKKNHKEKLDHEFSPYTIVEEYPNIEAEMWERGNGTNTRSTFAWLRHRFCLLFSTSGILRCESLYKAELSDFLGLPMQNGPDPHQLSVMIMQIPSGKSSKYVLCVPM
jgi:hypothetical protein